MEPKSIKTSIYVFLTFVVFQRAFQRLFGVLEGAMFVLCWVFFRFCSRIGLRPRVLFVFGAGLGALVPDPVWGRPGGLGLRVFFSRNLSKSGIGSDLVSIWGCKNIVI